MASDRRQTMVAGLALIGLGLVLYWLQQVEGIGAWAVPFVVGAFFLAGYLYRRQYGLLIPACILLGLGAGMTFADSLREFGAPTQLGLGFGFIGIYLIALLYERRSHWWPLIPGSILILLGLYNTRSIVEWLLENWPLVIVLVGLLVFISALGRRGKPEESKG